MPSKGKQSKQKTSSFQPTSDVKARKGIEVLFVHPAKQGMNFKPNSGMGRPYGLLPVGLPALVNVLRTNDIPVKGVSHPLEAQLNPSFNLVQWLGGHKDAKIVLIDMHWYEHCYGAIDTARAVKQALPHAWTVLGGLSASGFSREILEQFEEVDFIIRGDAEKPLLALVQSLLAHAAEVNDLGGLQAILKTIPNLSFRADGVVVENPLTYTATSEDLDQLDFVDISFLEHNRAYFVHEYIVTDLNKAREMVDTSPYLGRWTTTARGCRFNCSYCGGGRSAHKKLANRVGLVVRSPEMVVQDLVRLAKMGVIQASMTYDIAEISEDYWRELFDRIKKSGVKIGLYNEFFQMPDPKFIEEFVKVVDPAHSCLALSPLSGNEKVRRLNGKHYGNDEFFNILDVLGRHRAYLFVYFSLNLPGETEETFEETLELAQSVYEFYPNSLLKILNTVHTIDPLAPMNVNADKFGITSQMKTFKDYYLYCYNTQFSDPSARTELYRGFVLDEPGDRSLEAMASRWDRERTGKEISWWPIPPSW